LPGPNKMSAIYLYNELSKVKKNKWLYQDLSLRALPGETWDLVPGFDGEYEVSSYGRIKSLSRWREAGKSGY